MKTGVKTNMKHTIGDLYQMQSLPLDAKIAMTQTRIREWYDHWDGQVYVGFSGGKDSTVLKHIVDGLGYYIPSVFVNTGLEYPEIQRFVRDIKAGKYDCFNSNVEIIRPAMRFDEVINTYGYPVISKEISERIYYAKRGSNWAAQSMSGNNPNGTPSEFKKSNTKWKFMIDAPFNVSHKCCNMLKKNPVKRYERTTGRKPILGTMASESALRRGQWTKTGCNGFSGQRPLSRPISFWTDSDVLEYIDRYNVPYCSIYGSIVLKDGKYKTTGEKRTGCMFCMFGAHLEKEPNRFQRMKQTHPRQYEYCMNELGLKDVLDYIGVKYD